MKPVIDFDALDSNSNGQDALTLAHCIQRHVSLDGKVSPAGNTIKVYSHALLQKHWETLFGTIEYIKVGCGSFVGYL
jgi:hypothetical protein